MKKLGLNSDGSPVDFRPGERSPAVHTDQISFSALGLKFFDFFECFAYGAPRIKEILNDSINLIITVLLVSNLGSSIEIFL